MTIERKIRGTIPPRLAAFWRAARLAHTGVRLVFVSPRSFNDKVRWRMLFDRRSSLRTACDKVAVRDYVAARVGERYLIPLLGAYERGSDIPWQDLTPPFVVKPSHGSGWYIVVRSAAEIDAEGFRRTIDKWMTSDFYTAAREWAYKGLPRKVLVERFVGTGDKLPENFKFYCFGGEPRVIHVDYDSSTPQASRTFLDPSWELLPFKSGKLRAGPHADPPARLAEMLEVARALSREFDFMRVDLYCSDDHVYFGELTPTPAAGYYQLTNGGGDWLGALWQLPERTGRSRLGFRLVVDDQRADSDNPPSVEPN